MAVTGANVNALTFIREMTGAGGVMIAALGLNVLGVTNVRVATMLPAIAVVALIVTALLIRRGRPSQ